MTKRTNKLKALVAAALALFFSTFTVAPTFAIGQFAISPMYQQITLTPGETYTGNFEVINPGDNTIDFRYEVRVEPFSVEGLDDLSFTENGNYNQIVDWIELSRTEVLFLQTRPKKFVFLSTFQKTLLRVGNMLLSWSLPKNTVSITLPSISANATRPRISFMPKLPERPSVREK